MLFWTITIVVFRLVVQSRGINVELSSTFGRQSLVQSNLRTTTNDSNSHSVSEDMSLCLNTTDFLDAFLPIPPEGPLHPRSEGLTFDGVLGFASERDLAERWVSFSILTSRRCIAQLIGLFSAT